MSPTVSRVPLELPSGIEFIARLGRGRRCAAVLGERAGRRVVVKLYHAETVSKYRRRFGVEVAQLEFDRNRRFHEVAELQPFVAEPLAVLAGAAGGPPVFVQEFVPGRSLEDHLALHGALPPGLLARGRSIQRDAASAGLFDFDFNAGNVLLRPASGGEVPTLFDFNLVPQHERPPNPFIALAFRLGLRRRDRRDLRNLRDWEMLAARHAARLRAAAPEVPEQ